MIISSDHLAAQIARHGVAGGAGHLITLERSSTPINKWRTSGGPTHAIGFNERLVALGALSGKCSRFWERSNPLDEVSRGINSTHRFFNYVTSVKLFIGCHFCIRMISGARGFVIRNIITFTRLREMRLAEIRVSSAIKMISSLTTHRFLASPTANGATLFVSTMKQFFLLILNNDGIMTIRAGLRREGKHQGNKQRSNHTYLEAFNSGLFYFFFLFNTFPQIKRFRG